MCLKRNTPSRHALIQLHPGSIWKPVEPSFRSRLLAWFAADRPTVMARLQGDEPSGYWRLGVPLPPEEGKRRLALIVAPTAVNNWRPALHLRDVLVSAPTYWVLAIQVLLEQSQALNMEPRVYGSFAWQTLTGLSYVTPKSDLDLLWEPRNKKQLESLFEMLQSWEGETGFRADGEVQLPDGSAICWRELASQSKQVLVKTINNVTLQQRQISLDAVMLAQREGQEDELFFASH